MKVKEDRLSDVTVCSLEGEININNSPELRKIFEAIIKKNDKKVLLDFTQVSYVDSSGLATLIEMFQRLKKIGGHMRMCGMNEKIRNIFEITKLHKLFDICDTKDTAIKDF